MASGKLLRQLIKSGAEGNLDAFRQVSKEVIQEERAKKHHLLANDLERILYGRKHESKQLPANLNDHLPKDREQGIPLLHIKEPTRRQEDVVLSDENSSMLEEILQEQHRSELLRVHGLYSVDRLLFCGPPGCGKSLTAEVIASDLSLPLAVVRIDSVISSFLGETASNLRQVFDFISAVPMVVLFDEFDALGKERDDTADHGELKRVVNSFLQLLDAYEGKSLLIAATNHDQILDSAVWRRFDEVLVFDLPNNEHLRRLLGVKLRGIRRDFDIEDANFICHLKGLSHADVERILRRAIKDMIFSGKEFLNERHIQTAIRREDARRTRLKRS